MKEENSFETPEFRSMLAAMFTQVLTDARAIQQGNANHFTYTYPSRPVSSHEKEKFERQIELELNKQERSIRQFINSPEYVAFCKILGLDRTVLARYVHEYLNGELEQDFEKRLEEALKVSGAGRRQPHGKAKKTATC